MCSGNVSESLVESEFASVYVAVERTINGTRVVIRSKATGRSISLDALELEGLTWCETDDLLWLVDPALVTARRGSRKRP